MNARVTHSGRVALATALACLVVLAAGCGGDGDEDPPEPTPSSPLAQSFDEDRAFADLRAQIEIGPRPAGSPGGAREVAFIVRRLREAGVRDVEVQAPWRNVVATVGTGESTIVVGAHHDTKDIRGFVGANDGASGVAVVLELARVLAREGAADGLGHSVTFVLFDAEEARGERPFEEDGTRGSRQFVELAEQGGGQGAPEISDIEAMYLLDLVGDCDLQIPLEAGSDPELYGRLEGPAFEGESPAVLDDHIPFLEAGVPAVDLIDFDYGPGPSPGAYWHTTEDTIDKVCPESLGQVGRAVIGALAP